MALFSRELQFFGVLKPWRVSDNYQGLTGTPASNGLLQAQTSFMIEML